MDERRCDGGWTNKRTGNQWKPPLHFFSVLRGSRFALFNGMFAGWAIIVIRATRLSNTMLRRGKWNPSNGWRWGGEANQSIYIYKGVFGWKLVNGEDRVANDRENNILVRKELWRSKESGEIAHIWGFTPIGVQFLEKKPFKYILFIYLFYYFCFP